MNYLNTIILGTILSGTVYSAVPSKYRKCNKTIVEPRDSEGYYWDKSCSTIFVLPPSENEMKVSSISHLTSNAECRALRSTVENYEQRIAQLTSSNDISNSDRREIKRLEREITRYKIKNSELSESRIKILSSKQEINLALIPVKKKIELLEKQLEDLDSQSYSYIRVANQLKRLEDKKARVDIALEQYNLRLESITEKETNINAHILLLNNQLETLKPEPNSNSVQVAQLYTEMSDFLKDSRSQKGAEVKIEMLDKHTDLVKDFKRRNPQVSILKIPTKSYIQFKVTSIGQLLSENTLEINIPGVVSNEQTVLDGYANINFGGGLSGSLTVSSLSSCMLKWNEQNSQDLSSHFIVNLLNSYNVSVTNDYKLEYNLKDIYKKIKSNTSKGGFFKTKSINSVSEYASQNGSLKVTFNSQDPRDNYDKEEKDKIKEQFIARILSQISTAKIPFSTGTDINLPQPRENAASGASRNIKKCRHLYCQIAGYALDLGNSLFGNTETSARYLRQQDYKHTEALNETKMYTEYSTGTFAIKE